MAGRYLKTLPASLSITIVINEYQTNRVCVLALGPLGETDRRLFSESKYRSVVPECETLGQKHWHHLADH